MRNDMDLLVKTLLSIGVKLLTSRALEDFILFVAKEIVKRTDTKADDEFIALVEKHIRG
jgi:hypothetical protein